MARFLKLDRIEIQGFKSFYGRTLFDFPSGITAVVGPNGCGKSNIGDAISWVLGEQKASSLRSDRMEDVIFNGTQGRKPLGMAEVSLHFGNVQLAPEGGSGSQGNGRGPHPNGRDGSGNVAAGGGNGQGVSMAPATDDSPESADRPVGMPLITDAPDGDAGAQRTGAAPQDAAGAESTGGTPESPEGGPRFYLENFSDEVVVTRRLYRSGDSEYILNGQRCRLRDVQDLLSRTEIGTRLYTMIEQGKIDQVLSAKPKERRAIIEEAAGILGYKIKRRQSEVKLEAAQANLLRIADIVSEVEKQINSLRRQAGKARRYRRLIETLRERRKVLAYRKLISLDEGRRSTQEAIDRLRTDEAAAAAELTRNEAEVEGLRRKLEEGEEAARSRRDRIHHLDMEIDRLQGRIRSGDEQSRDMGKRIEESRREIEELRARIVGLENRREELSAGLAAEVERVAAAETAEADVESQREAQSARIHEREAALDRRREDLMTHLDEHSGLQRRRASLDEQIRLGSATLTRLERESAECTAAREAMMCSLAELQTASATVRSRIEERVASRDRLHAEEREVSERLAALERHAEERKGRAATLTERLLELRELERQHAGYGAGVGELLRGAAGFSPRGVVGERLVVPQGLERSVAAALGELCEAVLIETADQATRGISHLRTGLAGRVAFVRETEHRFGSAAVMPTELAERPGVQCLLRERIGGLTQGGVIEAMLSRAILVDTIEAAIAGHATHPDWDFVTPGGEIVRRDGVIIGGEGPELHHGVLARRAELAEVERRVTGVGTEVDSIERRLDELRAEARTRSEALEAAASVLQEAEKGRFQSDLQLQQQQAELERLERAGPMMDSERERIGRDLSAFSSDLEEIGRSLTDGEVRRQEMEEAIRRDADDLTMWRQRLDELQKQVAEARATVAAGRQRIAALERERATLDEGIGETRARREARDTECIEWQRRITELRRQELDLKQEHETALGSRAEAAAEEEAAMAGLAYDRSLLHSREQTAKEGRATHDARRQDVQEQELTLARLAADFDHLAIDCREDLETTPEALRSTPPEFDAGRALSEEEEVVAGLKAGLESIGPVNLMAIEQCSELEERFGFLGAQKKDLEDAMASLRETIRKINRESRQRFLASFEAIQTGFQECFSTLFGGGHAELRLQDDDEDVLDTGIEIAAQPPGKKLQSLTLLSGGEKALTAVALLFAMFRYRPSPFCVLDEVDAPLDEANVARFTGMLRQFTEETQFILITHNRKSMEAADILYGITMEEPGVSKVLPLRFE